MNSYISKDSNRINPMSHTPGGAVVEVIYQDGYSMVYDKVKHPQKYVEAILAKSDRKINLIKVDDVQVYPDRTA